MDELDETEEIAVERDHAEATIINTLMDYRNGMPIHIIMDRLKSFERRFYD